MIKRAHNKSTGTIHTHPSAIKLRVRHNSSYLCEQYIVIIGYNTFPDHYIPMTMIEYR